MKERNPDNEESLLSTPGQEEVSSSEDPICYAASAGQISEGPFWWNRALWWIDVYAGLLHRRDPNETGWDTWNLGMPVGSVVPIENSHNRFIAALQGGFYRVTLGDNGSVLEQTLLTNPEPKIHGNRFNDGKCDPQGRFWAGTMSDTQQSHAGSLYCLDQSFTTHKAINSVTLSNGLAWSSDSKTFYYIDTPTLSIEAFDFDPVAGKLSNRRAVWNCPPSWGYPDGMTIDSEDNLWIGFWNGSAIRRLDPIRGEWIQRITLPCSHVTSCCFGGPDLSTLFITTAKGDDDTGSDQPMAGHVFAYQTGTRGIPTRGFSESSD
tara:strand:- start:4994 stop:5953 length:960 start_codon:yes stop_codon:yes gene_type:complete